METTQGFIRNARAFQLSSNPSSLPSPYRIPILPCHSTIVGHSMAVIPTTLEIRHLDRTLSLPKGKWRDPHISPLPLSARHQPPKNNFSKNLSKIACQPPKPPNSMSHKE